MKKTKDFDCVEMKRKAAERIYEETKDMSLDERIEYWRTKEREFLQAQATRKARSA